MKTEQNMTEQLLKWYDAHARILPWRENPEAYRVWISEIMLQQTRVEAVKPFFDRFLKALPTIQSLAEASEDELLKLWEGLGYYNRVRNMQKAAKIVMEEYGGALPADYEKLLKLPGIGHYTAGAIGSIAFGIPMPAVDGNVLRIWSRIHADDGDILSQSVKHRMEEEIRQIIPADRAGDFNQALIELGAIVCVPNGKAKCEECPAAEFCKARALGIIEELPKKKKARARRIEERTVLVLRDGDKVAIRKRPGKGLLAGLYELPNLEGHLTEEETLAYVKGLSLSPIRIQPLAEAKHIFSHIEWHMKGYVVRVEELETSGAEADGMLFIDAEETEERYPIPAAFAAYAKYMNIMLGQERYDVR